jgi:hypothetical protein
MQVMENNMELEAMKAIFIAEKNYERAKRELNKIQNEEFEEIVMPSHPTLKRVNRVYPEVRSQLKINWFKAFKPTLFFCALIFLALLLYSTYDTFEVFLMGVIGFTGVCMSFFYVLYYILFKQSRIKIRDQEKVYASREYQEHCQKLNRQYDAQDAKLKVQYEEEMKVYSVKKKEYDEQFYIWTSMYHPMQVNRAEDALREAEGIRSNVYTKYNVVPTKYRYYDAISYLYEYMSSSSADIKTAIEAYDREQQAEIAYKRARLEEERNRLLREELDWQIHENESAKETSGGSFIGDVVSTAIGASIANRGIKKELEKQRQEAAERENERKREEDRKRREEAHRSQVEWEKVRKENEKRRRNGQPELPYPERFYW